jgi:UDP-N-acetylglucosamine acyltransferase
MNEIHPTAVVAKGAELDGVHIGPFCIVGEKVRIGKGSRLLSHVSIDGDTALGPDNVVFPFTSLGAAPQDLKYGGEASRVRIGTGNQIRESVTIHRGTESGHMETRVGDHCMIMAYAHIAHDCVVGNRVVLANGVQLAGHVVVDDFATLGGLAAVHQFSRVGTRAFVSAGSMLALDAPPYCIAEGRRAKIAGINIVGLQRAGFDAERITAIKRVYKEFFAPGRSKEERLADLTPNATADVLVFLDFIRASKRGVMFPLRRGGAADEA